MSGPFIPCGADPLPFGCLPCALPLGHGGNHNGRTGSPAQPSDPTPAPGMKRLHCMRDEHFPVWEVAATHRLTGTFRPPVASYTGPPAEIQFGVFVCAEHATQDGADQLRSWAFQAILSGCRAAGKLAPVVKDVTVRWDWLQ